MAGPSDFWFSMKLIPMMLRLSSLRKNRMPWNLQVSPAQRRVHDTHRGNSSERYRFDIHRANCSSGCIARPDSGSGLPCSSTIFPWMTSNRINMRSVTLTASTYLEDLFRDECWVNSEALQELDGRIGSPVGVTGCGTSTRFLVALPRLAAFALCLDRALGTSTTRRTVSIAFRGLSLPSRFLCLWHLLLWGL